MRNVSFLALAAFVASAGAQTLTFDVASIRPDRSGSGNSGLHISPGRLTATNLSLKELIQDAFDVRDFQVIGGPGWIGTGTYDVDAQTVSPGEIEEWRTLLRALLADRFKLRFHRETKELAVYSLVLAKTAAAKNGSKLTGYTGNGNASTWGITMNNTSSGSAKATIRGSKVKMADLAKSLSPLLDRTVVDNTELTGEFDFTLEWAPNQTVESTEPSLFTALQDQLGLKLDSAKGPVGIIVIDRAEKASEN